VNRTLRRDAATAALAVLAGCSSAEPGQTPLGTTQEELAAGAGPGYNPLPRHFPTKDRFAREVAGSINWCAFGLPLSNHGGSTITSAHVVAIFWGQDWVTGGSLNEIALSLQGFIGAYGNTGEYNVITQYSGIQKSPALLSAAIFDGSQPPTNVTDAAVQAEVLKYINNPMPGSNYDPSAIYEVFLPSTSYSSNGNSTSCGGPNVQYCAYHGYFTQNGGENIKYAAMPYPSCGGCQSVYPNVPVTFSDTQNIEHFVSHETREAVTDEYGNAWYDWFGCEADDKCNWSPAPFTDCATGHNVDAAQSCYAYQYEWSNKSSRCVQTM
jgi:hypothetical protein